MADLDSRENAAKRRRMRDQRSRESARLYARLLSREVSVRDLSDDAVSLLERSRAELYTIFPPRTAQTGNEPSTPSAATPPFSSSTPTPPLPSSTPTVNTTNSSHTSTRPRCNPVQSIGPPFRTWKQFTSQLSPEDRAGLKGAKLWAVAKEEGQRNGRMLAEERMSGRDARFIGIELSEAEKRFNGPEGFWIGSGLDYEGLEETEADFCCKEFAGISLVSIFFRRHGWDASILKRLTYDDGVVFGEQDLSEDERRAGTDWEPVNVRITDVAVYLVGPEVRDGDKRDPANEHELNHIIFNSKLRVEKNVQKERRYQSADSARKSSPAHFFASYVLASYTQRILESEFSCMDESALVVGAPKLLFTLEWLVAQIIHRDFNDNLDVVCRQDECILSHDPVSMFLMANVMKPTKSLNDTDKGYYDFGGAEIGILPRQSDAEIISDVYRQFGVLRGEKRTSTNLRALRERMVRNPPENFDIPPRDVFTRRYLSSFQRHCVRARETLVCASDVPHHGLAAPDHEAKKKYFDVKRGTSFGEQHLVRFWPHWPNYVNNNVWRLWPRYHVNADKANNFSQDPLWNRELKMECVGDKTKLDRTFVWDLLHPKYVQIRTKDVRPR